MYVDEQQSHDMVAESELVVGAEETEGLSWDFVRDEEGGLWEIGRAHV